MHVESFIETAVSLALIYMKNLFKNELAELTHSLWFVGYGMDELTSCRVRNISLHYKVHTGSGNYLASYPWGNLCFFLSGLMTFA